MPTNSGVNERNFQRHSRWKTSKSRDRYVKDSISSKLQVSKSLGLLDHRVIVIFFFAVVYSSPNICYLYRHVGQADSHALVSKYVVSCLVA